MITPLAVLLLAAGPASPCAARGDAHDDVRARACELLGAIDVPVSDGMWRALGPAADEVLAELARSEDLGFRRARALEGLAARAAGAPAAARGPLAERVHRELLDDRAAPIDVRRAAVRGLSRLLPPAELAQALLPLAERDADGRVRQAASEALARRAPSASCAGIRTRAGAGGAEAIRLERALAACAAAER